MKLSEVKKCLAQAQAVNFKFQDGIYVPAHFHVTEIGEITKNFIDCGGKVRKESLASFQLWEANDYEHRLNPGKLLDIITLSERVLGIGDHEVEVEYQSNTIGKYNIDFDGKDFILLAKHTACLAKDQCGQPLEKQKLRLSDIAVNNSINSCTPGGGCC